MNSKPPIAYVICGFIGAGKTTFARKLEKEIKAIRITKDEWMIKIFGNKITSDMDFERYDKNVTELAREFAFKILKSGGDVIIDEGFWVKSQRDDIKKKILYIGAKPILYYVECPVEKMRERVVNRSKTPSLDSFEINEEMFDKYLKYWEPPIVEEDFLLVLN
jgi:predicted kinase